MLKTVASVFTTAIATAFVLLYNWAGLAATRTSGQGVTAFCEILISLAPVFLVVPFLVGIRGIFLLRKHEKCGLDNLLIFSFVFSFTWVLICLLAWQVQEISNIRLTN